MDPAATDVIPEPVIEKDGDVTTARGMESVVVTEGDEADVALIATA